MACDLVLFGAGLVKKQAVSEVVKCNNITVNFGLFLTEAQAVELIETRSRALMDTGRVEFGGGIVDKVILMFCDSPYISMHNYEETLHELIEIFYYYKNEALDLIGDDELIKYMKTAFNGICQGSLDLLAGRELYNLARGLRFGYSLPDPDDTYGCDGEYEDE